ncbi:hypothetical protein J5N97_013887 [Dioscorea zingiberensis]|uniref:Uncharacterized protein n=1 Tax=Dioscorea zingiberensis TaxID=325984 RepID=A0A9D5CU41_9LILI|nr:hypothetical protein J5N97_013887 [Dioscorea zingiberensis]
MKTAALTALSYHEPHGSTAKTDLTYSGLKPPGSLAARLKPLAAAKLRPKLCRCSFQRAQRYKKPMKPAEASVRPKRDIQAPRSSATRDPAAAAGALASPSFSPQTPRSASHHAAPPDMPRQDYPRQI